MGADTVTEASFLMTSGAGSITIPWTGTLFPYHHTIVNTSGINAGANAQNLVVTLSSVNNGNADTVTANNQITRPYIYAVQTDALPLTQGFDSPSFPTDGWLLNSSGEINSKWTYDDQVKRTGNGSVFSFNTIFIFNNSGRRDEMLSPVVDLTTMQNPGLSFDVSYNYTRYTPPYFTDTVDFADTLEVLVSYDCGQSYQSVYRKSGAELATFATPNLNPLNIQSVFTNPADSNWRTEQILLDGTKTQAIVKFSYISGLGGSINIDNVRFHSPTSVPKVLTTNVRLYPNPASDELWMDMGNTMVQEVSIRDLQGRFVLSHIPDRKSGSISLNTNSIPSGLYTVTIRTTTGTFVEKLVIQH